MKTLQFTKKDIELIHKMENSKYFRITASGSEICIGGIDKMPRYFRKASTAYKYFLEITK